MRKTLVFLGLIILTLQGYVVAQDQIRFDRDIRPILSDKCYHCHGPDEQHRQADLRLDLKQAAMETAIQPGDADRSELVARILSEDPDSVMPPPDSNKTLNAREKQLLQSWIAEGAAWTNHWSFVPPQATRHPGKLQGASWCRNPIDDFVLASMEERGLAPTREANKSTLIRRLSYDLTGLPPSLKEVDAFLEDTSPDAYEKVVDRLLASKHFGERMAAMWLDAARYGDTSVYHADGPRDMWAWRDTVIQAYNDNMPFDRFSTAQLAGDLLPNATLEERILSGFNRNNGTTDEGGAIAEEYRVEYAVDRVKTTSTVWLGLTMECAQCHDHKYDPISQKDYYRFFAFFNMSQDKGMQTRDGNAAPLLPIPNPENERKRPLVQSQIESLKTQQAEIATSLESEFGEWLESETRQVSQQPSVTEGAILHAQFEEGKGKSLKGSATDTRGSVKGKAKWAATPMGQGLVLDSSNFVDFGEVANFERTDSFAYGGWVRPNTGIGALVAKMDDGNAYRGFDLLVGDGPVSVHLIHTWPSNAIKVTTRKKLSGGEWYHVMVTYDGSSQASGLTIYVNGEVWDWEIEQDRLTETIQTQKSLLVGSRHPGSRFNGTVDEVQIFDRLLNAEEVTALAQKSAITSILALEPQARTDAQATALREHFLTSQSDEYRKLASEISHLEKRLEELGQPLTTVMVMADMQQPRETFVLNRGAYDSPTDVKVEPGTISALPPMHDDMPQNRLGLAQWMFSAEQPLTARVAVNRYWQMLFGVGLVSTVEDFGAQGEYPSHPELLDWLAHDFRAKGWNIKRTLKQIVMSATYRQDSSAAPADYSADPLNRRLTRGPRFRLQAEFLRDTALELGGLLNKRIGGPGVKPYQPAGLWVEVGLGGKPAFSQDHEDKLYRRSIYTYWKRSAPPPTMVLFDAPTREKCTLRRPRTNTPLQALVVLNDPQFVEAARHFAERIMTEPKASNVDRIIWAFRTATSRLPSESEVSVLLEVLQASLGEFADSPETALELLSVGESVSDPAFSPPEHAAWTIVASTIFNLDETLTRP